MSSITLAFSSDGVATLSQLPAGARGVVVDVLGSASERSDRLIALGVTPGARVEVLQRFPGIVFKCDETELAIERGVAAAVIVRPARDEETRS